MSKPRRNGSFDKKGSLVKGITVGAIILGLIVFEIGVGRTNPELLAEFKDWDGGKATQAKQIAEAESKKIKGIITRTYKDEKYDVLDIKTNSSYEAERNIEILNKRLGGVLKGKGKVFVVNGIMQNVNPIFMASMCMQESGNGKSPPARNLNNVAGIMIAPACIDLRYFNNVDQCIEHLSILLKRYYIDGGKNTLTAVGNKFCPVGVSNDPTGLNNHWIPNVKRFYEQFLADIVEYEEARQKAAEVGSK